MVVLHMVRRINTCAAPVLLRLWEGRLPLVLGLEAVGEHPGKGAVVSRDFAPPEYITIWLNSSLG